MNIKAVSPQDCILAFGIPTTEQTFRLATRDPRREFSRQFIGWSKYEADWILDLSVVLPDLKKWGVQLVEEITLPQFGNILRRKPAVTILFTHTGDGAIEMSDGLHSAETVIDRIPLGYAGTLDLATCHPLLQVDELVKRRPKCRFRYVREETIPLFWVHFFHIVFWLLRTKPLTYLDAVEQAIDGLSGKASKQHAT